MKTSVTTARCLKMAPHVKKFQLQVQRDSSCLNWQKGESKPSFLTSCEACDENSYALQIAGFVFFLFYKQHCRCALNFVSSPPLSHQTHQNFPWQALLLLTKIVRPFTSLEFPFFISFWICLHVFITPTFPSLQTPHHPSPTVIHVRIRWICRVLI